MLSSALVPQSLQFANMCSCLLRSPSLATPWLWRRHQQREARLRDVSRALNHAGGIGVDFFYLVHELYPNTSAVYFSAPVSKTSVLVLGSSSAHDEYSSSTLPDSYGSFLVIVDFARMLVALKSLLFQRSAPGLPPLCQRGLPSSRSSLLHPSTSPGGGGGAWWCLARPRHA